MRCFALVIVGMLNQETRKQKTSEAHCIWAVAGEEYEMVYS